MPEWPQRWNSCAVYSETDFRRYFVQLPLTTATSSRRFLRWKSTGHKRMKCFVPVIVWPFRLQVLRFTGFQITQKVDLLCLCDLLCAYTFHVRFTSLYLFQRVALPACRGGCRGRAQPRIFVNSYTCPLFISNFHSGIVPPVTEHR